jgi:hypothetical protein
MFIVGSEFVYSKLRKADIAVSSSGQVTFKK